jgi:uncharacterized protein (TIGR00369 family)
MKTPEDYLKIRVPFQDHLGMRFEHVEKGRAVFTLVLRPEHLNSARVAHGGVLLTLLDTTLGAAARSNDENFTRAATLDLSSSFMQPASGKLTAEGRVIRGGRSIIFCEGEIRDESGEVVAKAIGTFKYSPVKA